MLAKMPVEVRLISKPAIERNLTQRRGSGGHQGAGPFDASINDVDMRRHLEADLKCATKVMRTETDEPSHIGATDGAGYPFLDEHLQPPDLPWCQAASGAAFRLRIDLDTAKVAIRPGDRAQCSGEAI